MHAIILAGGFGTRLKSIVSDVPKPMADIQGKPFLSYLISYLKKHSITSVTLSVHYMAEKIYEYFGANYDGITIDYAIEPQALGTGGAIKFALSKLQKQGKILVVNGDSFVRLNLQDIAENSLTKSKIAVALRHVPDVTRYGLVTLKGNIITEFDGGKLSSGPGLINAGVYIIDSTLFDNYDLPEKFSFEVDFLQKYTKELAPIGFEVSDYFIDIGIPEDYKRACLELPEITQGEKVA